MTRRACVIGYPVSHSRSPLIHNFWLREHGLDGEYVRHEVAPDNIDSFLRDFSNSGFVGANVTLPHKEAAYRNLAHADDVAHALGVANTLWLEQGALRGTNTDVHGFVAHLDNTLPGWAVSDHHAIVLGAGGAARAIVYGLKSRGVERITVVNRSRDRAEALLRDLRLEAAIADYAELPALLPSADLLVNTTSLGMKGQPPLQIDLSGMKQTAAVSDIVYAPLETDLLRQARARGLRVADGLGMLLHQAVPGFERWFGVRPQVTPQLRDHIVTDLEKGAE